MMRIAAYITFFLTLTFNLSAQTLAERYDHIKGDFLGRTYFGASIGTAIPFNEYASSDPNKLTSGYAKIGYTYAFTFRYAFNDFFGLGAKYFNTTNQFDAQKLQNQYNDILSPATGDKYIFTSDPWTLSGFMIVPTYLYKSPKYNVEIGVGVGKVTSTLPQNSLTIITPPDSTNIFSKNTYSSSNWAISLDFAFRYMVSKNVILSAQSDVLITDQSYTNIYTYLLNSSGYYVTNTPSNYLQPFRIVHLTIGIGFQLDQ